MVGKFSGKSKAEGREENLTQSRKGAKVKTKVCGIIDAGVSIL